MRSFKKGCGIFTALLLLSCSTVRQDLSTSYYYKRDISITLNKIDYTGVAVIPYQAEYEFLFQSPGRLNMFVFTTCHREVNIENAKVGTVFVDKNAVKFKYIPSFPLEKGYCPIFISAYDLKGQHSFGMIDIINPEVSLSAKLSCNGEKLMNNGASICQSKEGLIQSIEFPVEVIVSSKCNIEPKSGTLFTWKMQAKECVYSFMEKLSPNREHRLTTIGYQSILIRENL